jgi:kynureninase
MTTIDALFSADYAKKCDEEDILASYRKAFHFPSFTDKEVIYLTGNSLGLQPKSTAKYIQEELDEWAKWGVEGHFHAKKPWFAYHEYLSAKTAKIVGAKTEEVVVTHSLTTNLHLLMVSFYQPKGKRTKVICEAKAFPSDQYALISQINFHGLRADETLIEIAPRKGAHTIEEEDIIAKINEVGDELALVMIGGVNYYTGQVFDMKKISAAAHQVGAMVGFDLAHAAGNIVLHLHDWEVDFAAWCSYKYLNSGPGNVSGLFVHEKHAKNADLPRFAGRWGHDKSIRFLMEPSFKPMFGAEGWQLSNAPVFGMAAHLASLDIFDEVGMPALRAKSEKLVAYLETLLEYISSQSKKVQLEIITPKNKEKRGSQLSILVHGGGKPIFDQLTHEGVIADWREPNVIRIALAPLYNSYTDAFRFAKILEKNLL